MTTRLKCATDTDRELCDMCNTTETTSIELELTLPTWRALDLAEKNCGPTQGDGMTSLEGHQLDCMDDPYTAFLYPEFEVWCTCGHSFTAQGSDRIEAAITMWGQHAQEATE